MNLFLNNKIISNKFYKSLTINDGFKYYTIDNNNGTYEINYPNIATESNYFHEFEDARQAIKNAEGIFTGGGNTFVLVTQLHKNNVMDILSEVVKNGTPYLGTSAGSNICGLTMQTTNDMPIVYPPSFKTLGLISFNLNPHYLDPDANSKHMGETRETRIKEYHAFNTVPVLGLREGSWLDVKGDTVTLKGDLTARLFRQNQTPEELKTESDLSFIK